MTEETTARAAAASPGPVPGPESAPGPGTAHGPGNVQGPETAASRDGAGSRAKDMVTVRMPAEGAYLSVLRTATAGLAARLDFTLDEIEDLRIAVDEACAMLLPQALPGTGLECEFELGTDSMMVAVSVRAAEGSPPARDTFAWTVLTALAGNVDASVGSDGKVTIVLQKSRSASRDG